MRLLRCFTKFSDDDKICNDNFKKGIPNIVRRVILPFYIPVLALMFFIAYKI